MRLWSLNPRYLDAAGLVACWREGLLARTVVGGKTIGYRRHPQLTRFYGCADPVVAVDTYLSAVLDEALRRGYRFDASKIGPRDAKLSLAVTDRQLSYELEHLRDKLRLRSPHLCPALEGLELPEPHPMFRIREGDIENWEIIR